jgi:phage tail-like protein
MSSTPNTSVSSYLDYLPAVLQDDPFLGSFLLAFEAILSGLPNDKENLGFEQILSDIHTFFAPAPEQDKTLNLTPETAKAPKEFLSWLAGWVALSLRDDWEEQVKRDFIQQIVPLYQKRGTKEALTKMLKIYLQKQVTTKDKEYVKIFEFDQIPHYFQVQLVVDTQDLDEYNRKEAIARAIIEQEKPAHTIYSLRILMPTMRLVKKVTLQSEAKLKGKEVSEEEINKRRLLLFSSYKKSQEKQHQNNTLLGTTTSPLS